MKDVTAFLLCLLGAMCAECIPLSAALAVAALILTFWPERRRGKRHSKRGGRRGAAVGPTVIYIITPSRAGGDKEEKTA